jgi:hypothetical protein
MTEIAQVAGLSRERIRQRLKPHGRSGSNPNRVPSAEAIRQAIQREFSLRQVARLLNVSVERLLRGIERANLEDEVEAAFAARAEHWRGVNRDRTQAKLLEHIQELARAVGHTPTQMELMDQGVFHAELARVFGSAAAAMKAAGLEPNVRGQPPRALPYRGTMSG